MDNHTNLFKISVSLQILFNLLATFTYVSEVLIAPIAEACQHPAIHTLFLFNNTHRTKGKFPLLELVQRNCSIASSIIIGKSIHEKGLRHAGTKGGDRYHRAIRRYKQSIKNNKTLSTPKNSVEMSSVKRSHSPFLTTPE